MKLYTEGTKKFSRMLSLFEGRHRSVPEAVSRTVERIISRVRDEGDSALFDLTRKYDCFHPGAEGMVVTKREMEKAFGRLVKGVQISLSLMAERIRLFHERQKEDSYSMYNDAGGLVSFVSLPVERAGIYAPGGKAAYPSTVLMNAIPAKVAGVEEVFAAVPSPGGTALDEVLGACYLAGVDGMYKMGGAQAIAAFAFGTKTVKRVDIIAGPGNQYVAEAKRQLFGTVGIDMLAGPSELVVLADSSANPRFVSYDMVSQAEHGEDAFVSLVTNSRELAREVEFMTGEIASRERRKKIISAALMNSPIFLVGSIQKAVSVVNRLAPEHLSVQLRRGEDFVTSLNKAGTIFVGPYSPVAVGDYLAGINHTLPTGGSARFSSPLGVYNFMKRMNVVSYTEPSLKKDMKDIARVAKREGLYAHGNSVAERFKRKK